jgi:hypothetical protein
MKLSKQQKMTGDTALLFGDESEVLTSPVARARARRGTGLGGTDPSTTTQKRNSHAHQTFRPVEALQSAVADAT